MVCGKIPREDQWTKRNDPPPVMTTTNDNPHGSFARYSNLVLSWQSIMVRLVRCVRDREGGGCFEAI